MGMSPADRALWASARTFADLGELMARWLEGGIRSRPAYTPGAGPDEETGELIPLLAAVNRAGFLTDNSQPGDDGPGYDGRRWQQRAAVEGFITDHTLLNRVLKKTRRAGLLAVVHHGARRAARNGETVTWRGDDPHTAFGCYLHRRDVMHAWQGISHDALAELVNARQVALIEPQPGPSTRLWDTLTDLTGR